MSERAATDRAARVPDEVRWHEVECGGYVADLPAWRELAAAAAGPVLELGCGCGRVALDLARHGHEVTAVDSSSALLAELRRRAAADGLEVETVEADVRRLELERRFALACAPMQLVHLLGGASGREAFMRSAGVHLAPGGALAVAILAEAIGPALEGEPALPDVAEHEGWVYSSQPIEVLRVEGGFEVRRLRQLVSPGGGLADELDVVFLDELDVAMLEREARAAGLGLRERIEVEPTHDHVGSTIVVLEGER
jgi:SAM-dependent methyltransferase